jgi:hypothetical protein
VPIGCLWKEVVHSAVCVSVCVYYANDRRPMKMFLISLKIRKKGKELRG